MRRLAGGLAIPLAMIGACGGEDVPPPPSAPPQAPSAVAGGPAPPDAGTRRGHGADRLRVAVPRSPAGPPEATVEVAPPGAPAATARASVDRDAAGPVRLRAARVRATTVGDDATDGVARVRISIAERMTCRDGLGRRFVRRSTRYFPPPEIERVRSTPGARLPTRLVRSSVIPLATSRCGAGAVATAVHGEVWGEAVNGSGLEAVTRHVRVRHGR
jgi:hypothetical protein